MTGFTMKMIFDRFQRQELFSKFMRTQEIVIFILTLILYVQVVESSKLSIFKMKTTLRPLCVIISVLNSSRLRNLLECILLVYFCKILSFSSFFFLPEKYIYIYKRKILILGYYNTLTSFCFLFFGTTTERIFH